MVGTLPVTSHSSLAHVAGAGSAALRLSQFPFKRKARINRMDSVSTAGASSSSADTTIATVDGADASSKPWLFVGLGNPGKRYQGTRHNVGFEMIDVIAEAEGISLSSLKSRALLGEGYMGNFPIILAKPQTFMNSSGESVAALVASFKVPLNQVLLIYDDMDLPFAKLRLLPKGGHGGHNGIRSVIDHFKGNRDFPRLKIGIGRPPANVEPVNFVLQPFDQKERHELDFTLERGLQAVRLLVLEGFNKSATFANSTKPSEIMNR